MSIRIRCYICIRVFFSLFYRFEYLSVFAKCFENVFWTTEHARSFRCWFWIEMCDVWVFHQVLFSWPAGHSIEWMTEYRPQVVFFLRHKQSANLLRRIIHLDPWRHEQNDEWHMMWVCDLNLGFVILFIGLICLSSLRMANEIRMAKRGTTNKLSAK